MSTVIHLSLPQLSSVYQEFDAFTTDGSVLFCKYCEAPVTASKKFQVQQHLKTSKHIRLEAVKSNSAQKEQQLLLACSSKSGPDRSQFNADLCKAFVSADIPLHKLNNKCLKSFLEQYTGKKVPDESTLRKNYAPSRTARFSEIAPSTPLPPSPVVTRWGSWIDAATYYGKNFDVIEAVIATFDPEEAQSIQESKILLETEGIKESLLFIATNFVCISSTITRLEERGLLLSSAISLVNGVLDELKSLQSDAYYGKLSNVLYKNKGFEKLKKVSQIMSGDAIIDETVQPLTMSDLLCMKHAPIVSCDVERVFSEYKAMLTDNRRGFNFENLRHHVIIKCNHNL
ncbi:CGG triplet repeat-binding protein 1-like 11 [Homarus americanus]|uniref:CGG triplet repeat-binding protein 1-like 11 n=1 Tax=Homarus americanus TaxID=6706 RepID=A0A8J5JSR8_HOMAM|nr:CGG triplet repeat-binding protein 1-like 11 [Homarus americanus]